MRCLEDREDERRPDRADERNLAQQFSRAVLVSLNQQITPHFLAQRPQGIELLIVELRPAAYAGFGDFTEPCGTIARRIDLLPRTRNPPASVDRLQPTHHPFDIF